MNTLKYLPLVLCKSQQLILGFLGGAWLGSLAMVVWYFGRVR